MQVAATNNNNYNCVQCQPQPLVSQQAVQPAVTQTPQVQYATQPQVQPQNVQVPSTSGVNIQIFNPSVSSPGAQPPTYNVNAPNYYPPNYYTGQIGANPQNTNGCTCPNCSGANAGNNSATDAANTTNGSNSGNGTNGANNGNSNSTSTNNGTDASKGNNGANSGVNSGNQNNTNGSDANSSNSANNASSNNGANGSNTTTTTTSTTETDKKTEKKNIVMLTDQYIMNLENYLNSQEKDIRLGAAKEVYARLEEDPSRKDDKALTALINKMLQDPDEEIRILALAALDGRYVLGDDYTVGLLQNMQKTNGGYGQDATDAAQILLKMSAPMIEKEVEVDPARQKKTTTEKKETKKAK